MGWALGRHILRRVRVPETYLPARRDEWPPGERYMLELPAKTVEVLESRDITLAEGGRLRVSRSDALQDRIRLQDRIQKRIPRPLRESPLSMFWTAAMAELADLYRPFSTPSSTGNRGSLLASPNSLVQLTLSALVPTVHTGLAARLLWDRLDLPNS